MAFLHQHLRAGIHGRSALVENQDRRRGQESPRNRRQLVLTRHHIGDLVVQHFRISPPQKPIAETFGHPPPRPRSEESPGHTDSSSSSNNESSRSAPSHPVDCSTFALDPSCTSGMVNWREYWMNACTSPNCMYRTATCSDLSLQEILAGFERCLDERPHRIRRIAEHSLSRFLQQSSAGLLAPAETSPTARLLSDPPYEHVSPWCKPKFARRFTK